MAFLGTGIGLSSDREIIHSLMERETEKVREMKSSVITKAQWGFANKWGKEEEVPAQIYPFIVCRE